MGRLLLGAFTLTLFQSALLLFWVQPMVGKILLPYLGGTPAVWNTCMVFFQALLLGGYSYAHLLSGKKLATQCKIHLGLVLSGMIPLLLLHFQVEPFAEEKLITCVQGIIFDVVVDLRPNSRTFGKWTSFELSAENALQAYLPKGVAHGFQTLMPDSIIHYSLSSTYSPEFSYAINPFGDIGIDWPITGNSVSQRDLDGISFLSAAQKYAESLNSK